FFFQAEDGIRDKLVTGVQTCALPIWIAAARKAPLVVWIQDLMGRAVTQSQIAGGAGARRTVRKIEGWVLRRADHVVVLNESFARSEERRVGKECRCRCWGYE